jgi:hypothetical protein
MEWPVRSSHGDLLSLVYVITSMLQMSATATGQLHHLRLHACHEIRPLLQYNICLRLSQQVLHGSMLKFNKQDRMRSLSYVHGSHPNKLQQIIRT